MGDFVLAHDVGTSGAKASIYDSTGRLAASASCAYETRYPARDHVEQDPQAWWSALAQSSRLVLEQSGTRPTDIAAIGISGQMMGCVAVGEHGEAIRPALIWADNRATRQAGQLARNAGTERVYRITGHRASASYSAAKIAWLRDNEHATYANTRCFLQAKDYILVRATGRFVTDHSDASGTNLYDLESGEWSAELIDAADIDGRLLPQIVKSTDVVGSLLPEAARDLGLAPGTPFVAGGGDGSCAAVGAGAIRPAAAYACLGSSSWIGICSQSPLLDPDQRTFTWAHLIDGLFLPTGTMQTSGLSVSWIESICAGHDETPAELEQNAAMVPPGSRGLLFLPYLLGERSPRWDPTARGSFVGLTMRHGSPELVRATLEGIALNLRTILDCFIKLEACPRMLWLIGGGAASALFRRILASVLDVEVRVATGVESASALGAAVAAGIGVGLYDTWEVAERARVQVAADAPSTADAALYGQLHDIFEDAYSSLEAINGQLAVIEAGTENGSALTARRSPDTPGDRPECGRTTSLPAS